MVDALKAALGKPIEYDHMPYDAFEGMLRHRGWPEWQAKGVMQLYRAVDAGENTFPEGDFQKLTAREPTNVRAWVESVKAKFRD